MMATEVRPTELTEYVGPGTRERVHGAAALAELAALELTREVGKTISDSDAHAFLAGLRRAGVGEHGDSFVVASRSQGEVVRESFAFGLPLDAFAERERVLELGIPGETYLIAQIAVRPTDSVERDIARRAKLFTRYSLHFAELAKEKGYRNLAVLIPQHGRSERLVFQHLGYAFVSSIKLASGGVVVERCLMHSRV